MTQICLIGKLGQDPDLIKIAQGFHIPVCFSETGEEFLSDKLCITYFIVDEFDGPIFDHLWKMECRILGPLALKELGKNDKELPPVKRRKLTRPVYCYSMKDAIIGIIGFSEEKYDHLVKLCYFMGANVMKDQFGKITHLVASSPSVGEYWYGRTFSVPIMAESWITSAWRDRDTESCYTDPAVISEHKLKFSGLKISFMGFDDDECEKMTEILIKNKGQVLHEGETDCDYLVVNDKKVDRLPDTISSSGHVVTSDWFWSSMETEQCEDEKDYLFQNAPESNPRVSRGRKRKRVHRRENSDELDSPLFHKRRSVSRSTLLNQSSDYLNYSESEKNTDQNEGCVTETCQSVPMITGRYQVFKELLDTEENYVTILKTILKGFKEPLQDNMTKENAILNPTEVNIIFGKLPSIYELHSNILKDLRSGFYNDSENFSVGNVILKYAPEMEKAYCPFINYFENMKQTLELCNEAKPRFRAFLEEMQEIEPDCQKQSLKELLIWPVQRLPRVELLLKELKKKTDPQNADYCALEKALICIMQTNATINENKKRTEAQIMMLNLPNEIENCPPDLVSSDRSLVFKCECVELTEILSSKKQTVLFLLFTDAIEICKKQTKPFNTFKTPKMINAQKDNKNQYKHVRRINLTDLRKVINIKESEECQKGFAILYRTNESLSENLFKIIDESVDKLNFLNEICKQIVNTLKTVGVHVRKGPNDFYDEMEANEISPDSALNVSVRSTRSFSKALRFSVRGGLRRVLSMSKTPKKLKREMSTIEAFVTPGVLTRNATQKKLQSCANLNELNFTPPRDNSSPIAPMTVPAPRRNKLKVVFSVSSLKF